MQKSFSNVITSMYRQATTQAANKGLGVQNLPKAHTAAYSWTCHVNATWQACALGAFTKRLQL